MIDLEVSFVAVGRSDTGALGDGAVAADRSTRAAAMERYAVKVRSEEVGQTVHPPPQVEGAELLALGAALSRLRAAGAAERDVVGTAQELFARLFAEQNRALYDRAKTIAEHTDQPLRLLLALSESSPLHAVPWELLHDGSGFLGRRAQAHVVRFLEGPPLRPAKVAPPVRILVSAASPPGVEHLGLEPEIQGIRDVCAKIHPAPDLEIYRDATYRGLERVFHAAAVQGRPYHVWHHCGHGGFRDQGGDSEFVLALGKKRLELVSVDDLLPVLRVGSSLRVVVLNVCSAAAANGLALALARINVPFVVGFSSKIGHARARRFAIALFGGLLRVPLEAAVDLARAAIPERDTGACSWSEPQVLGRRSDDGGLVPRDGVVAAPAQQSAKPRHKTWRQKTIDEVRAQRERDSKQ